LPALQALQKQSSITTSFCNKNQLSSLRIVYPKHAMEKSTQTDTKKNPG
jgi:hypothetical protein